MPSAAAVWSRPRRCPVNELWGQRAIPARALENEVQRHRPNLQKSVGLIHLQLPISLEAVHTYCSACLGTLTRVSALHCRDGCVVVATTFHVVDN